MSITPLTAASLAESTLFNTLTNDNSTSSSATNLVDSFLAPSDSTTSSSIFPDFPTEATLTSALTASLGTSPTADSTTTSSTDPDSLSSLTQDFTTLLKDLASGDTTSSQSAVAKLQADLNAAGIGSSTSSSTSTSNPLQKLLTSISSSLTSGDTTTALQSLAGFLVQGGSSSSGTLVNTSA